jgi:hypothetical protein
MRVLVATKYKENLVVVRQLSSPEKKIDFSVVFKKFRLDRNCPYYTRCSNYSLLTTQQQQQQQTIITVAIVERKKEKEK